MIELSIRRNADDGSPELIEGETVELQELNTSVIIDQTDIGSGTLLVTNRRIIWSNDSEMTKSWACDYPSIVLHAVSRDTGAYPKPCIYCQLKPEVSQSLLSLCDSGRQPNGSGHPNGADSGDEEEDSVAEMRIVPTNEQMLEVLFTKISECSAMNPDEDAMDDESDEDLGETGWVPEDDDGMLDDADEDDEDAAS